VDEREDGDVRAQAEGHRENGDSREARTLDEAARGDTKVVSESIGRHRFL
jgi:hypothetical protein